MRNLLGRLNARPPDELAQIAAFWRVPVAARDRRGLVGPLYRTLTDPRAVRAAWDRLAPNERDLVRFLALNEWPEGEGPPTLAEIASRLGIPEPEARRTAVALYRAGILAREGDDDPLPVGTAPRLFLPRELALLFRRVQDEIEVGDLSGTPLRALLELLDDAELEEAAQLWGLRVIPGLRARTDLTEQLLRQVGDAERVAAVVAKRRRDAARIWERVRDAPDGAPVPLPGAAAAAGLDADGDDPRMGQRLRAALAELETSLLVWHTYRPDGSRWLFVPVEIRSPRPPAADVPPLAIVAAPTVEPPPWRHPDALAWDLLTLLREVAAGDAFPWSGDDEADLPRSWLRRVNARLWHRGEELPPPGYLSFLAALALGEGVLRRRDDPGAPVLELTPVARAWRDQTFPAQSERLRGWWLASSNWIEGAAREAVEVWGADWRGARRKLVAHLAELEAGTWYGLDSVAARVAAADPGLLGDTFTAATARHAAGPGGNRDAAGRAAAIAEVVEVELETALAWFGLVELGDIPGHARAVRVTDAGLALARDAPPPAPVPPSLSGPALVVSAEGEVRLHDPTPLRVWSLSAFADAERLDRVSVYRLSAGGLARALGAGFDLAQVVTFLSKQSGEALPPDVAAQLAAWARGYRRIRLQRAVVLTPDDPAALAELERLAAEAGLAARPLTDTGLLVEMPVTPPDGVDPEEVVAALLRDHGYAPQWGQASVTGSNRHRPPERPATTPERDGRGTAQVTRPRRQT